MRGENGRSALVLEETSVARHLLAEFLGGLVPLVRVRLPHRLRVHVERVEGVEVALLHLYHVVLQA